MTGPTCANGHPVLGYIYDANGWKTWCATCGAPLNHEPNMPSDGYLIAAVFVLAMLLMAFLFWLVWLS